MRAARIAFRTPLIGRKLYGLFREGGFHQVHLQVLASADTEGALAGVLRNMASYARTSGELEESLIDEFLQVIEQSLRERTYLAVLPQFLATGHRC